MRSSDNAFKLRLFVELLGKTRPNRDFVTGFHKRKKKRRKEAQQKLQEAERRKLIEARKKRKLEREFVIYGGAPPESNAGLDESDDCVVNEEEDLTTSVSGTQLVHCYLLSLYLLTGKCLTPQQRDV
ncbi:hypothetical protein M9H77_25765 [Catharanthus roseus]|uniref:Uncharacterized protein n=1 Tax=Catharanthus roseus TaxID=4058 RepID=A0ACC0AAH2_CATRO|nr:hypothetical protein M9H77_25765 [Catharanthus roseus]